MPEFFLQILCAEVDQNDVFAGDHGNVADIMKIDLRQVSTQPGAIFIQRLNQGTVQSNSCFVTRKTLLIEPWLQSAEDGEVECGKGVRAVLQHNTVFINQGRALVSPGKSNGDTLFDVNDQPIWKGALHDRLFNPRQEFNRFSQLVNIKCKQVL